MRATAFFLAGLVAACAFEQDSTQPALRVSGHDKMVYAEALPAPGTIRDLVCGQARPGRVPSRGAVPMGSRRKAWAPVPPPRLPDAQHPTRWQPPAATSAART